ncbi:hypothetical protein FIBSPDRAFT_871327 [Athelia psychrophila]|uniref:Ammonium transporter AmtB-like domain-containing protein n=1 Tax=Athelia psychrophila TaxID=1759441 RepID=A0A166AA24_9AGAM|nr:hypothetical protein FIBSPDRAFT_871327 [Fibularhizoctonia sp. CBS 109695]
MLWDYRLEKKWSAVGFCSGAGLVAITPASGFVGSPAVVLFSVAAGTVCNFATQLKFFFRYDDALDIVASHAIGGVVGNVLTGIFAQKSVAAFDGVSVIGGWLDGHFIQLGYQMADSVSRMSYSFVMTTIILWAIHFFPGGYLELRCSEESEVIGMDDGDGRVRVRLCGAGDGARAAEAHVWGGRAGGRGGRRAGADASCAPPGEESEQRGEPGGREGRGQRDAALISCT